MPRPTRCEHAEPTDSSWSIRRRFDDEIDRMGVGYFRDQGFDVTLLKATGLSRDPSRIHTEGITDCVSRRLGDGDEGLFMAGNGFRAAWAVPELEQRTGRWFFRRTRCCSGRSFATTNAPLTIKGGEPPYGRSILSCC